MGMQFITLIPVEILRVNNGFYEGIFVHESVIINSNRVKVLYPMGSDYRERFNGDETQEFYATASVEDGTFLKGTMLALPPAPVRKGDGNYSVFLHWWLTEREYLRIMGIQPQGDVI